MSTLSNIQQDIERTIEKAIYDILLEHGYIADRATYANDRDGYITAMQTIAASKGFCVEVFGYSPSNDKGLLKVPRITINSKGFFAGSIGNDPTPYFVDNGSDFNKMQGPATSSNLRVTISLISNKSSQDRVLESIRQIALPNRLYLPFYNDVENSFLLNYAFVVEEPDLGRGIIRKHYTYEVIDIFETSEQYLDNINKIQDITVKDDNADVIIRKYFNFSLKIKTDNAGTSDDNQFTIPTNGSGYNYTVEWGDGTKDVHVDGSITHTYSEPGEYSINIFGDFPSIYFNNTGDKLKVLYIQSWGDIKWKNLSKAFYGCSNLDVIANDAPDLSNCISITQLFPYCTSLVGNSKFGGWKIEDIDNGFGNSSLLGVFHGCTLFNQDLSSWDTSQVNNISSLFQDCKAFNQDLSSWDTSQVTAMQSAFDGATDFDQDLTDWNYAALRLTLGNFIRNSGLSVNNYNNLLIKFKYNEANNLMYENLSNPSSKSLGANGLSYSSAGQSSRSSLISTYGWSISGDVLS